MTDDGFSEYRRLIEDFIAETRRAQQATNEELRSVREELVRLRTQLVAARWIATPFIAAVVAGVVSLLFKHFGG